MSGPGESGAVADPGAGAPSRGPNVEIVIPTFNEELNLPHALESVRGWPAAVHVVDSESTDATRELAEAAGANVVVRPWLGYAAQKNWALDNLPIESEWVFILDADESITPELRDEILAITRGGAAGDGAAADGYYVNRLTYFLGRPIRHCGYFPSWNLRLFRHGRARYEDRDVHEHMIVDGETRRLKGLMLHNDRRGLEHFIAKHNRYSTLEAGELSRRGGSEARSMASDLESGVALRRWLKHNIQPVLPLVGFWRFVYTYFVRLGFLDGLNGLRFSLFLATYDFFIALKLCEARSDGGAERPGASLALPEGAAGPTAKAKTARAPAREPEAAPEAVRELMRTPAGSAPPAPADDGERDEFAARPAAADPEHPRASDFRERLDPLRAPEGVGWPEARSVPVSVLIPVKNEQRNLIGCMRHVFWADEVIVVDSQSTDNTIPIAQGMGADVYQFYYSREGWPKKKNWALEHVPWRNEWVLILDADEYMTPELAREVRDVVNGEWRHGDASKLGCGDGYWINRRFMFMGRWIRGCGYYPSWNVRLFKHRVGRYERIGKLGDTGSGDNEVHEHVTLSTGEAGYLREEFLHYAYPDLSAWIEKHNRYTTWEAHAMIAGDSGAINARLFGSPIERRRWLKKVSRTLPFRPMLRFLYAYFVQRGFLDGYPGLVMCRLLAWYELMSIAKGREMRTPNAQVEGRNR